MHNLVRHLMGVSKFSGLSEHQNPETLMCVGNILRSKDKSLPQMTPVAARIDSIQKSVSSKDKSILGPKIEVVTYFPPSNRIHAGNMSAIIPNKIHIINPKNLFTDHRVKDIEDFDFRKIDKIREYVKERGVVTFKMDELHVVSKFIQSLSNIKKRYNVSSFFGYNHQGRDNPKTSAPSDVLTLFISFFDLLYSIPIYNYRKVDGFGIRFGLYWPMSSEKANQFWMLCEYYLVVSSYPDNVLSVDGQKINEASWIGNDHISYMVKQLGSEEKRQKEMKKCIKKAKQSCVESGVEIKTSHKDVVKVSETKYDTIYDTMPSYGRSHYFSTSSVPQTKWYT